MNLSALTFSPLGPGIPIPGSPCSPCQRENITQKLKVTHVTNVKHPNKQGAIILHHQYIENAEE